MSKLHVMQEKIKTMSNIMSRAALATRAGLRFDNLRNYYTVFGYKTKLTTADFLGKYQRQDIVSRIIDAPPGATWSNPPSFSDATLQKEWDELNEKHQLWHKIQRADRLARLGHYSLLLFGVKGSRLDTPVQSTSGNELLYVRPISESSVQSIELETNSQSPLYGMPVRYVLKRMEDSLRSSITPTTTSIKETPIPVHASNVVHIVENSLEDEIFGIPIIERIFNLLDDLLKIAGGTAETYWLTSNRGMQVNVDKDLDLTPADAEDLADEIDEYMHNLRRFIRTRGVEVNNLGATTPSPEQAFNMIIALLAGATGIPRRILTGSEAGQLASEQDRANWAERVDERNTLFAEPHILRPTVNYLMEAGVLTKVKYTIVWPSAFKLSPIEEAAILASKGRAIGNISKQTGNKVPMQLTTVKEAREMIGLEGALPEAEKVEQPEETEQRTVESPAAVDGNDESDEGQQQE